MKKKKENKIYNYLTIITFILALACFIKVFFINDYAKYENTKFYATQVSPRKSDEKNNYYDGIMFELNYEGTHNYSKNGLIIYFKCYNSNGLLIDDDARVYMNGYTDAIEEYKLMEKLPADTNYCELNGVKIWDKLKDNYKEENYLLK